MGTKMHRTTIYLPADLKEKIRKQAFNSGLSMSEFLRKIIEDWELPEKKSKPKKTSVTSKKSPEKRTVAPGLIDFSMGGKK